MDGDIRFGTLSIDCPDAALLCRFYAGLLHGRAVERYGCPAVVPPEGPVLLFMQEEDFVPCGPRRRESSRSKSTSISRCPTCLPPWPGPRPWGR